jgi:hypothetical protein
VIVSVSHFVSVFAYVSGPAASSQAAGYGPSALWEGTCGEDTALEEDELTGSFVHACSILFNESSCYVPQVFVQERLTL